MMMKAPDTRASTIKAKLARLSKAMVEPPSEILPSWAR